MLNDSKINEYETYVHKLMTENEVPGFAVGLSENGIVRYQRGFGYRNIKKNLEPSKETVFGIGSITKSFTCIAIMQLQEAGKLSVHDPVSNYLPEFRLKNSSAAKEMTIHHFMTHTTGIPSLPIMSSSLVRSINEDIPEEEIVLEVMNNEQEPSTYKELMDAMARQNIELLDAPGKVFSYNNECYCLLGALIERVSGMSYESYIKENIIKLIGMKHTGFTDDDFEDHDNITALYLQGKKEGLIASNQWWDTPVMRSTGLLKSTISDMLIYTELFRTNGVVGKTRILKEESVQSILTPYIKTHISPDQYYGYGLRITKLSNGDTLVEHTGNGKAVSAFIQIIPERGFASIGLSNKQLAPVYGIVNGLMNLALNKPLEHSRVIDQYSKLSSEVRNINEYVGVFQSGDRGPATVKLHGEHLILTSYGASFRLDFLMKDIFKLKGITDDTVSFLRNTNNEIDKLSFRGRIHTKESC